LNKYWSGFQNSETKLYQANIKFTNFRSTFCLFQMLSASDISEEGGKTNYMQNCCIISFA